MKQIGRAGAALALVVGVAGTLTSQPATASVRPAVPTAAQLCPSATPSLADLRAAFAARTKVNLAQAAHGFKLTLHRVQGSPSIAHHADIYSDDVLTYTYDAKQVRARQTDKGKNYYQKAWSSGVGDDIYDAPSSSWWSYRYTVTPATNSGARLNNATLAQLHLPSVWTANRVHLTAALLASGRPDGGGGSNDLSAFAGYTLANLSTPLFTCTVSGRTATVGITAAGLTGTLKLTVAAGTGAVTGLSSHLLQTGVNGFEESQSAGTVYAAQTVIKPKPVVAQKTFDLAMNRAVQRLLAQSVVNAATPKVKKQGTLAGRVKALRGVVPGTVASFVKTYVDLPLQVTVSQVPNGVRLRVNTHTTGVAPSLTTIVVKGSSLVVTYR